MFRTTLLVPIYQVGPPVFLISIWFQFFKKWCNFGLFF